MKYFLKLNLVSLLYSVNAIIPLELMINVYRFNRLTNWKIGTINTLIGVMMIALMISGTFLLYSLTRKCLNRRKSNFWTTILWVPYFVLLVYLLASLFPIVHGGDTPNPATGFLAIGGLIIYPFYILIVNVVCMASDDKPKSHIA